MRFLIAASLFVGFSTAHAEGKSAPVDVCSLMTCGTFEGKFDQKNPDSDTLRITIAPAGDSQATFDYTRINKSGEEHTWPLVATFNSEGLGTLLWKGTKLYATTLCKYGFCNYALIPFQTQDDTWGNAGIMRFQGNTLEFMMTVGTPVDFQSRSLVLQKK